MKTWVVAVVFGLLTQDAVRVTAVDEIEKNLEKTDTEKLCRDFAATHAGVNAAILTASSSGKFFVFVSGVGKLDGVSLAVVNPPAHTVLVPGNGGRGGKAGRSAYGDKAGGRSESGASGASNNGGGGQGGAFSVSSRGLTVQGFSDFTGDGGPQGEDGDIPSAEELKAIKVAVDALASGWEEAAAKDRAKLVQDFASKHRPTVGVVAAWAGIGEFLVVVAANASAANPDGISVEVAGVAAKQIVVIAGNRGVKGKAGKAKGPKGALTRDGT